MNFKNVVNYRQQWKQKLLSKSQHENVIQKIYLWKELLNITELVYLTVDIDIKQILLIKTEIEVRMNLDRI